MAGLPAALPDKPLMPALRQELRLLQGPQGAREASWLIHDPIRHRYFQVSREVFELLALWRDEAAQSLAERAALELQRAVSEEEINTLAKFLIANNLVLDPPMGDARALAAQEVSSRVGVIASAVHNYLFFKIPLFRPERFLVATLPFVAPLFSRHAVWAICLLGLAGLYLASRQWDLFVTTFIDFLSFEGALAYGLALIVIKAFHELGHAYTATHVGVRVNTMGIAFMVMTPVLYTDVTDAWSLRRRSDKLAIDIAGVVVELSLAAISLFLWAFLPDGLLRSAAFVTATVSLAMCLAVNLNPLMRFDGYYVLADFWGIPNLQSRSTVIAQWWVREVLFGLEAAPPELLQPLQRRLLILYALAAWIYRLFLFLGIAIAVYLIFFKALGIVLFVVEIAYFIILPIVTEVKEWWKMRAEIMKTRRSLLSAAFMLAGVVALIVPWSGTITVQGVALADQETRIFASRPAQISAVKVRDGQTVAAGDVLLELRAPDLEHDIQQSRTQIDLTRLRLDRLAGDQQDRSDRMVLEGEAARHLAKLAGLELELERLVVTSLHAGQVRDVDQDLKAGEWIDEITPVGRVVLMGKGQVQAYVAEEDVSRLKAGSAVIFVPEDVTIGRRYGRIAEIAPTGVRNVELLYLASVYSGAVPTDRNADGEIKPRSGRHLLRVELDGQPLQRALRGTLHAAAERQSIAAAMWRRVLQVLVRESGA